MKVQFKAQVEELDTEDLGYDINSLDELNEDERQTLKNEIIDYMYNRENLYVSYHVCENKE